MIVGVTKEIKTDEYRVAMIPVGVEELTRLGHRVLIQAGAGQGSGVIISADGYILTAAHVSGPAGKKVVVILPDGKFVKGETLGANTKVGNLAQMRAHARYEILVVNDSDIRVEPDYLRQVVPPLADPRIGLVTCLYRGIASRATPAASSQLRFASASQYVHGARGVVLRLHLRIA